MRQRADGHLASHDIHGRLAHKPARQHESVHAKPLKLLGDKNPLVKLDSSLETVTHIGLDHNPNVASGSLHNLLHAHPHEPHTIVERTAPTVAAAIGVGRQELAYEIAVTGMNLHAVHSGIASETHGIAKRPAHGYNLVVTHTPHRRG